ncbi:unnamed protein product, partial [Rotaria sp. Silwood2]
PSLRSPNLSTNTKWIQNGITVAGRNERGSGLHQLSNTWGVGVDDDQTIYIADSSNYRLVEWKCGATAGQVVAGRNKHGNRPDQLSYPADVIIDIERDSFIISDYDNKREVRWPRHNDKDGETIISNVECWSLAMGNDVFFYIVDSNKQEVRRYRMGESQGTLVAGGNGQGNRLNQLYDPTYIFVDRDHSVYVSDSSNHRVMNLTQLSSPCGIVVDQSGTVYVADCSNHRIMRWSQEGKQGSVIVGENGKGSQSNQLYYPTGLTFDREGNLYVSDHGNHRIQKFNINMKLMIFEN